MAASALEQLTAGAIAGSITALTMSPLDVVRTRMQIQHTVSLPAHLHARSIAQAFRIVYTHEGVAGFFAGYSSAAVAMPLYWSVYFPVYQWCKLAIADRWAPQPYVAQACSAIVAAACSDTITAPLWLVRTRLQTQAIHIASNAVSSRVRYKGLLATLRTIRAQEGTAALYKGLLASWMGTSHVAVQFPAYEWLRRELPRAHSMFRSDSSDVAQLAAADALVAIATSELLDPLNSLVQAGDLLEAVESQKITSYEAHRRVEARRSSVASMQARQEHADSAVSDVDEAHASTVGLLAASTSSKLIASLFTYPHETIRARLQDQRDYAGVRYRGIVDCAVKTYRAEGVRGLYSGFSVNLLRSLPACAVTFFGYEVFLRMLRQVNGHWS